MSYCCEECFSNEAIKKFIQENSSIVGECEYCGSHNVSLISPRTLGEYMCSCLEKAYEYIDEGTGAMYDSEDEMYLGPDGKEATVYSVREILMEEEVFADITDSDALLDELFLGLLSYEEQKDGAWSYHIIGERLIAYKYGKTSEVQVQNIEKSLNTIIEQFEEMKKDLVFLLSENEDQQD